MENRSWGIRMVDSLDFNQVCIYHIPHLLKWISWGLPTWLNVLVRHIGQIVCYWKCIPVKSELITLLKFRSLLTQYQVLWHWNFMTPFFSSSNLAIERKWLRAASMYMLQWMQKCSVTPALSQEPSSLLQYYKSCHYPHCYKDCHTVTTTRALSLLLKKDGSWWY